MKKLTYKPASQRGELSAGFTLIELLVVIAILGLLSALMLSNFSGARERARDMQRKSDLSQILRALVMYRNDYSNLYPANDGDQISACNPAVTKAWGSPFSCGTMVYMKLLPQDPSGATAAYKYRQITGGADFCLWATLENKSDSDIVKYQARCSSVCAGLVGTSDIVVCSD